MKLVLIADDEPAIRTLVRMALEDESFSVLQAADGAEALDVARAELPDLLLLDVTMPRHSGFEVCRRLKADPATRSITIVMLSSCAEEIDKMEGNLAGADEYLTKPFSPSVLVKKIADILAREASA